jgi:hypothetical protein
VDFVHASHEDRVAQESVRFGRSGNRLPKGKKSPGTLRRPDPFALSAPPCADHQAINVLRT